MSQQVGDNLRKNNLEQIPLRENFFCRLHALYWKVRRREKLIEVLVLISLLSLPRTATSSHQPFFLDRVCWNKLRKFNQFSFNASAKRENGGKRKVFGFFPMDSISVLPVVSPRYLLPLSSWFKVETLPIFPYFSSPAILDFYWTDPLIRHLFHTSLPSCSNLDLL